jgi:predicted nucleotidyltransferase
MELTQSLLDEIVRRIAEHTHPEKIVLFGSHSRGSAGEGSDIDLLIVKRLDQPGSKRFLGIRRRLRGMKVPMDIVVYTPEEIERWRDVPGSLVHEALATGRTVYHG